MVGVPVRVLVFFAGLLVLLLSVLLCFLYGYVNNLRLYFYLKKTRYGLWRNLTMIGGFGPGASNPFRWWPYLKQPHESDDLRITRYKNRIRTSWCCSIRWLVIMCAYLVLSMVVLYLMQKG